MKSRTLGAAVACSDTRGLEERPPRVARRLTTTTGGYFSAPLWAPPASMAWLLG